MPLYISDLLKRLKFPLLSQFAVHITHGFLFATDKTASDRIKTTMRALYLPTLLAFLSSLIGILLLLCSDFGFVTNYVFKPLVVCIVVTYLFGVWTLPVVLQCLHCVLPQLAPLAETEPAAADAKPAAAEEPEKTSMLEVPEKTDADPTDVSVMVEK